MGAVGIWASPGWKRMQQVQIFAEHARQFTGVPQVPRRRPVFAAYRFRQQIVAIRAGFIGDDTGRDAMPMQKFGHFIFPLQRVPIADLQKRALPARDEECPRLFGAAAVKDFCPTAGWTAAGFPHRGKFRFGPYRAASLLVLPAAGTHQPPEPTNRLPFCWKKSFMLRRICACMARRAASAFPSRIASRMCWCSGMDCLA